MVSLSLSVYSNKGVYGILVGSGISRASGIPTGWEVMQDLIRKVAILANEDCEPDPEKWFQEKYGRSPEYGSLLDMLAKTSSERQAMLRGYFEPTEEERNQGLKTPSKAHRAIAQLVAQGYLRVIITTNFDRMIETAISDIGITPNVISTTDQIRGALPLVHAGATIIKVNGDYLDTRLKNTEEELSGYDSEMEKLLDQVFDEYGMIVCGWSADWDVGLRNAMERCPSRRFATYWTYRSTLSEFAKRIIKHRSAESIEISDADRFFENLREKVQALRDVSSAHPLSPKIAVATMKRYLVDPSARIRLRDLVHEETERVVQDMVKPGLRENVNPDINELKRRVTKYEAILDTLLPMFITGCYWGDHHVQKLWVELLERVGNAKDDVVGWQAISNLRRYPGLLLLYGGGIASLAADNYEIFAALLTKVKIESGSGNVRASCEVLYPGNVIEESSARDLFDRGNRYTAASDYLFERLREYLREYMPRESKYVEKFDYFEYMFSLVHADLERDEVRGGGWWGPLGCFKWRGKIFPTDPIVVVDRVGKELEEQGKNWPPLKAGLFGGSLEQAKTAKRKFDTFLNMPR